ncbi:MAG TPA: hypothetical protein VJR23_00655 [Candidatus Acidoferrales bacterium]|nr:hypothetical protein [Candidatus Acidoferrales bacterium]
MASLHRAGAVALSAVFLLAACSGGGGNASRENPAAPASSAAHEDPSTWKPYVPPDGAFAIKSPKPPEIRGYGNSPMEYTFYGVDMHALGPLLHLRTSALPPEGAPGVPPPTSMSSYEAAYRGLPGAVVDARDITNGTYSGREFEVTGERRQPLMVRIFQVNGHQYWLEWNPTIAHSTDLADTFTIP